MAYLTGGNEEERRRSEGMPGAAPTAPTGGAAIGPAGAPGGAGPRQAAGAQAPGGGGGTGFTNLQTVMGLNQPQAQQLAGNVAGGIQQGAQQVQQGVQNLQNQFAQAQKVQGPLGRDVRGQPGGTGGGFAIAPGTTMSGWNPGAFGSLQNQAGQVSGQANAVGTGAGLQQYLQQTQGGGRPYTGGESSEDAFLAGQAGGRQLAGLGSQYGQLGRVLGAADQASTVQATPGGQPPPTGGGGAPPPKPKPWGPPPSGDPNTGTGNSTTDTVLDPDGKPVKNTSNGGLVGLGTQNMQGRGKNRDRRGLGG